MTLLDCLPVPLVVLKKWHAAVEADRAPDDEGVDQVQCGPPGKQETKFRTMLKLKFISSNEIEPTAS